MMLQCVAHFQKVRVKKKPGNWRTVWVMLQCVAHFQKVRVK